MYNIKNNCNVMSNNNSTDETIEYILRKQPTFLNKCKIT